MTLTIIVDVMDVINKISCSQRRSAWQYVEGDWLNMWKERLGNHDIVLPLGVDIEFKVISILIGYIT